MVLNQCNINLNHSGQEVPPTLKHVTIAVMLYTILMFVPQWKSPVFTVRRRVIMPESVSRIARMRWKLKKLKRCMTIFISRPSLDPPNVNVHVNSIKSCEQQKEKRLPLSVEGKKILFKLDTGSEVNILPYHMYESHCSKTKLVSTKVNLVGYFGNSSKPHGKVSLHVEHKQKFYTVEFMVIDSKKNVIGLSKCEYLNLVRLGIKQSDMRLSNKILKDLKYKSVFKGMGCIVTNL